MLALLAELTLDHLEIEDGPFDRWSSYYEGKLERRDFDEYQRVMEELPEDLIKGAAKSVTFIPPDFGTTLRKHWAGDAAAPLNEAEEDE